MSQNPRKYIIFGIIGIFIIIIIISTGELNSCGIQHVTLVNDIKILEQNSDPEFCENTVNKILEFNEQCEPYIEILDCG
ncbi:hypothetical protein MnTg01_00275 [archaeon MnTg01]|nr:hypothetical protein MnTg01_00275 [archaeon MnTg01]